MKVYPLGGVVFAVESLSDGGKDGFLLLLDFRVLPVCAEESAGVFEFAAAAGYVPAHGSHGDEIEVKGGDVFVHGFSLFSWVCSGGRRGVPGGSGRR